MSSVSQLERDLTLELADGLNDALMLVFTIRQVCGVAERTDYLLYLQWLVANNIKGQDFIRWWEIRHQSSPLNAIAYLRQKIYNDHKKRPLMSRVRV